MKSGVGAEIKIEDAGFLGERAGDRAEETENGHCHECLCRKKTYKMEVKGLTPKGGSRNTTSGGADELSKETTRHQTC